MSRMYHKAASAFTLIELMVVVAIIGILTAVLFASFDEGRQQSRDKVRMAELKEVQLAIELYKAQNGRYPLAGCAAGTSWSGPNIPGWLGTSCDNYIAGMVPDFLPALPIDPKSETDADGVSGYVYQTNAAGSAYKVMNHSAIETMFIDSYSDEFARCPYNCNVSQCNSAPESGAYAVYSAGAECW